MSFRIPLAPARLSMFRAWVSDQLRLAESNRQTRIQRYQDTDELLSGVRPPRDEPYDDASNVVTPVAQQPDSDESKLGGALAAVPDVQEVHYVAGEDGFMIKIRAADTVRLERIRREKIAALPQVRSTRTMIVLQTYKETARIPLDDSSIQKIRKRRT